MNNKSDSSTISITTKCSNIFNEDNLNLIRYNEELLENPNAEYKAYINNYNSVIYKINSIFELRTELRKDIKEYILLEKDTDLINNIIKMKMDIILYLLEEEDIDYCCTLIKLYNKYQDSSIDSSDNNDSSIVISEYKDFISLYPSYYNNNSNDITKSIYWNFCYRNMDCKKFIKVVKTLLKYNYRVKPNKLKLDTMITTFYENTNFKLTDSYLELFNLMNVDIINIKCVLFSVYGFDIYLYMSKFVSDTIKNNNNDVDIGIMDKILPSIINNIDKNNLYDKLDIILSEHNINSQEDIEDCFRKIFSYINLDCDNEYINNILTVWSYDLYKMKDKYLNRFADLKYIKYSEESYNKLYRLNKSFAFLTYYEESYNKLIRLNNLFVSLNGKDLLDLLDI